MRSCPKSSEGTEDQITQWLTITQQWLWPIKRTMAISKSDSSQTPFRSLRLLWTGGVVLGVGSRLGHTHSGTVLDSLLQSRVFLVNVDSSRAYSRLYTEPSNSSSQSTSGMNHLRIQRIFMIHPLQLGGVSRKS